MGAGRELRRARLTSPLVWYWLLKFAVVAPALVLGYAPRWRGREHLPRSGPFVLAANHTSVIETAIVPFAVNRRVTFVAKSKYYRGQGAKGRLLGWFLRAIGQVPIDPASASSAQPALDAAREILLGGGVWGIFPEGTRSPDGRMYRGRTGAMRVALPLGVPVIPVAVIGARGSGPWWTWGRNGSRRIHVTYLPPFDLSPWAGREDDPQAWREATEALMATIREVTGQEYADRYPTPEELHARDNR